MKFALRRRALRRNAAARDRNVLRAEDLCQAERRIGRDAGVEKRVGVEREQRRHVGRLARRLESVVVEILVERKRAGSRVAELKVRVLLAEAGGDRIAACSAGASSVARTRRVETLSPDATVADVSAPANPPRVGSQGDVRNVVVAGTSRGTDAAPTDMPLSVVMLASPPRPNAEMPLL